MKLLITGLIVIAGVSVSPQSSKSTPEELTAAARASEDTFRRMMTTIGEIVRDKVELQKSRETLGKRRAQLVTEYRGLALRTPATYENLYQDLVAFRQKQILLTSQLYGLAAESYGQRACENQSDAAALAAEILSSDLAQAPVKDSLTVGDLVRRSQQELHEDDPCAPSEGTDLSIKNQM